MTKGGSGLSARAQTKLVRHLSIQPVPISINVCLVRTQYVQPYFICAIKVLLTGESEPDLCIQVCSC